jgi:hypothetical protein
MPPLQPAPTPHADSAHKTTQGPDRSGGDWGWDEVADFATEEDLSLFSDL